MSTRVHDSLALLALKVAPNVFDLSTGQTHVSIRDQIVRGQLLVRDLSAIEPAHRRLLIVGAGVAGVSAAMAAADLDWDVCVLDTNALPFSLQRKSRQRFVGPFMYEWPGDVSGDQGYPPMDPELWGACRSFTPQWTSDKPMTSNHLATELTGWLGAALARFRHKGKKPPRFWMRVDAQAVKAFVKDFAQKAAVGRPDDSLDDTMNVLPALSLPGGYTNWPDVRRVASGHFSSRYVVLAAGMGAEDTRLEPKLGPVLGIQSPPFWADDQLRSRGAANARIGIFGGGDGGLQDVLRALTRFDHPLQMMDDLLADAGVRGWLQASMGKLQALEQHSRLMGTWTINPSVFEAVDGKCREMAETLSRVAVVRARVMAALRPGSGTVSHFVRESHFTKAYLLNRFLVHLVHACQHEADAAVGGRHGLGCMRYALSFGSAAVNSGDSPHAKPARYWVHVEDAAGVVMLHHFDDIAVRFGMQRHSIPGTQMVTLSDRNKGTRSSLSHVPVPFVLD